MDHKLRGVLAIWLVWAGATLMGWGIKLLHEEPRDGE